MQKTFTGYHRENGRVGVRNHVFILPFDYLSNAACEAVAHNIKGTIAAPHACGYSTAAEVLGRRECIMTKLYESA